MARPTKDLDRGYYIVLGNGTVISGPYDEHGEAKDSLDNRVNWECEIDFSKYPDEAFEIVWECGPQEYNDE